MKKYLLSLCFILGGLLVYSSTDQAVTGFIYQSPRPGARYVNPEQVVVLKTVASLDLPKNASELWVITGSRSGNIPFDIKTSDEGKTVFIQPKTPFVYGERIEVRLLADLNDIQGGTIEAGSFCFFIKPSETLSLLKDFKLREALNETPEVRENPSSFGGGLVNKENNLPNDFPAPQVQFGANHEWNDQYIFMNMVCRNHNVYSNYLAIVDDYGVPVYYKRTNLSSRDFKVLQDGYLTYSNNDLSNPANEKYYLMDSSFVVFDSVQMGNGYNVDGHDMLLLDNGHYLMMAYDPQLVDMSTVVPGGNPSATVVGVVLQEVDLDRNVYFQWRSWDHFQITDATYDIDLTDNLIDYVHANALEIDADGNILLSCRHMDEITKINFNTGQIIWRFGLNCENNMFTILQDELGFSHQHDIRRMANSIYTIYDNGNNHVPPISRALKYHIDEQTMVAYLDWSYQREGVYAPATGSFRTTEDGKKLIGWGTHYPLNITELNTDNSLSFDLMLPQDVFSYRAIKQPWRTNLFSAYRNLSMGNYAGYQSPKGNYVRVQNHSDQPVTITGTYNHLEAYTMTTTLPLTIAPHGTAYLSVLFAPTQIGEYDDVLTINADNANNTQRIARQVNLLGLNIDSIPTVFITPRHGSVNVDPTTVVQISFDVPVQLADSSEITDDRIPELVYFNTESFVGDAVGFSGHIDDEKRLIILFPDEVLLEQQQYYVNVRGNMLMDDQGHAIKNAEISYFTTGLINGGREQPQDLTQVTPNPFHDYITLESPDSGSYEVEVFGLTGRCFITKRISLFPGKLNTSDLKCGVYLIQITSDRTGETQVMKMIKQ